MVNSDVTVALINGQIVLLGGEAELRISPDQARYLAKWLIEYLGPPAGGDCDEPGTEL
jgi:hypothetical protein